MNSDNHEEKRVLFDFEVDWSQLLKSAAERAIRYREGLDDRRVAPLPESVDRLSELGGTLPEQPDDAETILALLDEIGSPATVTTAGGLYFGFVNGSSLRADHRRVERLEHSDKGFCRVLSRNPASGDTQEGQGK